MLERSMRYPPHSWGFPLKNKCSLRLPFILQMCYNGITCDEDCHAMNRHKKRRPCGDTGAGRIVRAETELSIWKFTSFLNLCQLSHLDTRASLR